MNDQADSPCLSPGSTSSSLLERAKARDPEAWRRLVDLYGPLVYHWCGRCGLPENDMADVFQDIFAAVAGNIDGFHRTSEGGSFRGWLRTITRSKIIDHFRRRRHEPKAVGGDDAQAWLQELPAPEQDTDPSRESEDSAVLLRALEIVRGDFEEHTWQAFWQTVVEDRSASNVALELKVSVNAVYKARARVLARLREELGDLIG